MTEPLYTYIKGEGWQIRLAGVEITFKGGNKAFIEYREPKVGEYYTYIYKPDNFWFDDGGSGEIKEAIVIKEFNNRYELKQFSFMDEGTMEYYLGSRGARDSNRFWLTVVANETL